MLCIISAEIGENFGISIFGFNLYGIAIAYTLGFGLAGFSTFMTILGRYDFENDGEMKQIRGCCSFLEENSYRGFIFNLTTTFLNFKRGFTQFIAHRNDPQMKFILNTSMIILITADSAGIITAETVTLLFYQYCLSLAIPPLALVIGTFTLTLVKSIMNVKNQRRVQECRYENSECKDCLPDSQSHFVSLSEFRRQNKEN